MEDAEDLKTTPSDQQYRDFLSWLSKLLSWTPDRPQPNLALLDAFTRSRKSPVCTFTFTQQSGVILHPWSNPLNGPLDEWTEGSSPCLREEDLPLFGKSH